jgi:hypothetical protein
MKIEITELESEGLEKLVIHPLTGHLVWTPF